MLPRVEPWEIGKLSGVSFTFDNVGDVLPLHCHEDGQNHITICNEGRLRIFGKGWERILTPGRIVKFDPMQEHAYEALEAGSKITNIIYDKQL